MSDNTTEASESIAVEPRTRRALTECMTVLPEGGDVYTVVGENGGTYRVAEHTDATPQVVATDGGVAGSEGESDTTAGDRHRVPVAGGVLVYEERALGKELVGFEEVENWDDVAGALAARGHGRGAVFHLPELDDVEERGA